MPGSEATDRFFAAIIRFAVNHELARIEQMQRVSGDVVDTGRDGAPTQKPVAVVALVRQLGCAVAVKAEPRGAPSLVRFR